MSVFTEMSNCIIKISGVVMIEMERGEDPRDGERERGTHLCSISVSGPSYFNGFNIFFIRTVMPKFLASNRKFV